MVSALPTDAAAIAASLADPRAFVVVFDRHWDSLYRYLRRRVGSTLAEELASETFARAFEHRGRFDGRRADARPWLFGIAQNLLRDHHRTEQRGLRALARTGVDPITRTASPGVDPGDSRVETTRLAECLAQLAPGDRDVLLLVAWGELAYEEVAGVLGVPVGTVRSRLNRARGRLRELLERSERYERETI